MLSQMKSADESTDYSFRIFEGRLSDATLQQDAIGQRCYRLDWAVGSFIAVFSNLYPTPPFTSHPTLAVICPFIFLLKIMFHLL